MDIDRVCVELVPVWITVDGDDFNHQKYEGHRWSHGPVSESDFEDLVERLGQVGRVKADETAHPASIKVDPTFHHQLNQSRIVRILSDMFGDDFDAAS